jgi:hypothetical protein
MPNKIKPMINRKIENIVVIETANGIWKMIEIIITILYCRPCGTFVFCIRYATRSYRLARRNTFNLIKTVGVFSRSELLRF